MVAEFSFNDVDVMEYTSIQAVRLAHGPPVLIRGPAAPNADEPLEDHQVDAGEVSLPS